MEVNHVKIYWSVYDAQYEFEDEDDLAQWKTTKELTFEFNIGDTDDGGSSVFKTPDKVNQSFDVKDGQKHKIEISISDTCVNITATICLEEDLVDGITEEQISEWSEDMNGWFSASLLLGDFDAHVVSDDGGEWSLEPPSEDP